jgi:TatD DNase family protein
MKLFDSHCHLDFPALAGDLAGVLARAEAAGVTRMCTIGSGDGLDEAGRALAIARQFPERVVATVGIHPHDACLATPEALREFAALAALPEVVAVGETGLDYHYDLSPRAEQQDAFRAFIQIARAVQKPLVIHTRAADEDTLAILREEKAAEVGGVIHCFSHGLAFGRAALELGFYLSIPGVLTFKKSEELREVVRQLPLEKMLIETDSPYLAPMPMRGKTNEPAFVAYTAKVLAECKGVSVEEVAEITTRNACTLYRLSHE